MFKARNNSSVVATSQHSLRSDWLSLRQEPIVAPHLPIVDSHHHLWAHAGSHYLVPEMIEDLRSGHNVVATVYVQSGGKLRDDGPEALRIVGETEFAAAAAKEAAAAGFPSICAGIVAPIDLQTGRGAGPVLEEHMRAGNGRFRGVRDLTHWDADPTIHLVKTRPGALISNPAIQVADLLVQMRLSLDVFCYHTQLAEAAFLARSFPELPIVLNHIGTPLAIGGYAGIGEQVFSHWRSALKAIADCPNVFLKFGGLGMRFSGFAFDKLSTPPSSDDLVLAWRRWFDACVDIFEPGRLMFESNFPMDKASFPYAVLWNAFKKLSKPFSADDQARMLCGTAAEVYRLEGPAASTSVNAGSRDSRQVS